MSFIEGRIPSRCTAVWFAYESTPRFHSKKDLLDLLHSDKTPATCQQAPIQQSPWADLRSEENINTAHTSILSSATNPALLLKHYAA